MPQRHKVPSNNPLQCCNIVCPIIENQKIRWEEIVQMPCQRTHELKARSVKQKENDYMYAIFGLQLAQNPKFVCELLKTFVLMYQKIFEERGKFYMGMKGLTLNNWMEAIMDGRKGDILALYGLSLLTDTHMYVHLARWTNVDDSKKCSRYT